MSEVIDLTAIMVPFKRKSKIALRSICNVRIYGALLQVRPVHKSLIADVEEVLGLKADEHNWITVHTFSSNAEAQQWRTENSFIVPV